MGNKSQTIRLIAVITTLIVALSGAGVGGWFLKGEDIENLEQTNKNQDKVLGETVYKTLDLEKDMFEIKAEVKEIRREFQEFKTGQDIMNAKLDILVNGYSGD